MRDSVLLYFSTLCIPKLNFLRHFHIIFFQDERLVRLFVVCPKTSSEQDLKGHFSKFGDIDYVSIVRDRVSKENKGFAYVKYHRMSHAAKAFEGCDRSYKPVFADPKPQKNSFSEGSHSGHHHSQHHYQGKYLHYYFKVFQSVNIHFFFAKIS